MTEKLTITNTVASYQRSITKHQIIIIVNFLLIIIYTNYYICEFLTYYYRYKLLYLWNFLLIIIYTNYYICEIFTITLTLCDVQFLNPLKTSEIFRGYRNEILAWNGWGEFSTTNFIWATLNEVVSKLVKTSF